VLVNTAQHNTLHYDRFTTGLQTGKSKDTYKY